MFKSLHLKRVSIYFTLTIVLVCLVFTLITTNNKPVFSQSITGLNAEIGSLRSRISRLESEVRNLRTGRSTLRTANNNNRRESRDGEFNNPPVVNNRTIGKSDPLFERLATLLIELKEDVRELENRLVLLEDKINN